MSANRWSECPKCAVVVTSKIEQAKKQYGKVSADEYEKMLADANLDDEEDESVQESLREDWELSVDSDGLFEVSYSCNCERCGFKFSYKHKESALKTKGKK